MFKLKINENKVEDIKNNEKVNKIIADKIKSSNNYEELMNLKNKITIKKENTSYTKYYDIMDIANKYYQNNLFLKKGKKREFI